MINKTFRLFISSTFNDFLEERKLLNEQIRNDLNDFCVSKGYNFQLVDLRWGINSESALNQKTLDICLNEVRRCKELSPKPNFLLMLGDRYGWIPLPYKIKKDFFKKIISNCNNKEKELLNTWYLFDNNDIGGVYYLKTRVGICENDNEWCIIESNILEVFHSVVPKIISNKEEINNFFLSATAHEIIEGVFEDTQLSNNAIALFRTGHPSRDSDLTEIINLKSNVYKKMKEGNCLDNLICLNWDENYRDNFINRITNVLKKNILEKISRLECIRLDDNIFSNKKLLSQIISQIFLNRNEEVKYINDFIKKNEKSKLCIYGESGTGKSSLLAQYINQSQLDIFYAFFGLNERCYSIFSVLHELCVEIQKKFDIRGMIDINQYNVSEAFLSVLNLVPSFNQLIIVIDALESFYDLDFINENFLSIDVPNNVKIIVSISDRNTYEKFIDKSFQTLELTKFNTFGGTKLLKCLLKKYNRIINNSSQQRIINNFYKHDRTPLQTKLLFNIIKDWHSYDNKMDVPIDNLQLVKLYIENMFKKYGHNRELVLSTLALIASAPYGITENELLILLFEFPFVKAYFVSEDRYNYNLSSLPFSIWSRLFYDMDDCLILEKYDGNIIVKFKHNIFLSVINKYYNDYCEKAEKILISFYLSQDNLLANGQVLNIAKLRNLPELLYKTNNWTKLEYLFCDVNFIDCQIKCGNIDYVILITRYLIENNTSNNNCLTNILECIYINKKYLEVYPDAFSICANSQNIIKEKSLLSYKSFRNLSDFHFPYGFDSSICWQESGQKYAVYNRNYIYICNANENAEVGRIFLDSHDENICIIKHLFWIDEYRLLVCSSIMFSNSIKIMIYNTSKLIPYEEISFDCAGNCSCVKFCKSENSIIFSSNEAIISINLTNNLVNYSISVGKIKEVQFDIDEAKGELIVRNKLKFISIYNIKNGLLKKEVKLKKKYGYYDFAEINGWINGSKILKIDEYTVLFYRDFDFLEYNLMCIYNSLRNKILYLNPPIISKPIQILPGKDLLIVSFEDFLLSLNLYGNYEMNYFPLESIKNISWKSKDLQLCIVTDTGIKFVSISDFNSFDKNLRNCFATPQNLLNGFNMKKNEISSIMSLLSFYFEAKHNEKYYLLYNIIFSKLADKYAMDFSNDATIIIFSTNGTKVIAYEQIGLIKVFDNLNNEIIYIDRLKLSILDNILNMKFSMDSNYLLIQTNFKIYIVSILEKKLVCSIDVSKTPVLQVDFKSYSNEIECLMYNYEKIIVDLNGKIKNKITSFVEKNTHKEIYEGPYQYCDFKGIINLLNIDSKNFSHPRYYVTGTRVYTANDIYILFENGEFYLNGNKKMIFSHKYIDFNKVLAMQRLIDDSAFSCYLREKNDLFSSLLKYNDNYYVLISRMMNSVLVFDIPNLKIISAYKHSFDIIGWRLEGSSKLILFSNKEPYETTIDINIY